MKMKYSLLVMATSVCLAIIVLPALVRVPSSTTIDDQDIVIGKKTTTTTLRYNTEIFNLENADTYSDFITSLRTHLISGTLACELPVTRATAAKSQEFVLVDLKKNSEKTITLAIDVTNVYVVGYRDKLNGKDRANFLNDTTKFARDNLFTGAATKRNIGFNGSYTALQRAASVQGKKPVSREDIELGVLKLGLGIEQVYDKAEIVGRDEARFLLIAIQMVSEAARFEYIRDKVSERGMYGAFKPDAKVISLENEWGTISKEIHNSAVAKTDKCTNIPPITLNDPTGAKWIVNNVITISPDMGILKFKKTD